MRARRSGSFSKGREQSRYGAPSPIRVPGPPGPSLEAAGARRSLRSLGVRQRQPSSPEQTGLCSRPGSDGDVTDTRLVEGEKNERYAISVFYPYFIASVHIILYILFSTRNSFHGKEKLLPLKQSDYTMSILQICTNSGSEFLPSADKCLHVTKLIQPKK